MKDLMLSNLSASPSYEGKQPTYRLGFWDPAGKSWMTNEALCEHLFALVDTMAWGDTSEGQFPTLQIELRG